MHKAPKVTRVPKSARVILVSSLSLLRKDNGKVQENLRQPACFLYFTVDYEGKNGDLDSYPDNFADDVYIVAYGVDGLVDTVDSEVYDTYKAYGITKAEMSMFV